MSATKPSWKQRYLGGQEGVFEAYILVSIFVVAFGLRLFAVIRFESIIHEFDPWFNFRSTRHLVEHGIYEFHNWFDNKSWYPLGRFVGGTVYPGLMWTASLMNYVAHNFLNIPLDIREFCVFTAPIFAGLTAIVTYLFTKECWSSNAGLFAAFFVSLVPGYVSRSVAGSYDNEAVAIFAMILTFWLWVKSVNTGSVFWSTCCALAYFYMVAAWGGYIFIINIIPVHAGFLLFCGRFSGRLYIAYCIFYIIGLISSMQIQFVSFKPVSSPEHYLSAFVFVVFQIYAFGLFLRKLSTEQHEKIFLQFSIVGGMAVTFFIVVVAYLGYIPGLTMRFLALLGSDNAIVIVKSVSEHQPTSWGTYWFDEHVLTFLTATGILLCFYRVSDANLFAVLYGVFSGYFSNIMIRLMLVVSPAMCVLGAIAISEFVKSSFEVLIERVSSSSSASKASYSSASVSKASRKVFNKLIAAGSLVVIFYFLYLFTIHCVWVTSIAYSSPSIVLQARGGSEPVIFDDFREAYQWLYHNTEQEDKVLSWWDYGYQLTGMGNKTVIVDNNTRNNTHIATVGLTMASREEQAYPILRRLDVKYVVVIFGGMIGYSSDDINKFLWMVRISGGVFPRVVESNYYNSRGMYTVDATVSDTMKHSIMYKMCYYRFCQVAQNCMDRTRGVSIGYKNFKLRYLEEAYTTAHW
eukprot:CAMPEP_0197033454 /NCGR_PEP_ID=MMETSP1384-20130603/11849_1 /TAXON_ID=29189 /ORGANISM="Ammonia sp." /LENGTH=687 /DNA_ID=CAMNT_0042463259 /DNA_START=17 /DNA_END=2077 /DNA_ORIENTATION=-